MNYFYLWLSEDNLVFNNNDNKWKTKTYHTAGIFQESNKKIVEICKIYTPNTPMNDHALSWLGTGTSIKRGGVKPSLLMILNFNLKLTVLLDLACHQMCHSGLF